jgi:dUTP pyrophosphatase
MRVEVVQLDPELALPSPALPGDAGLDLRARRDQRLAARGGTATLATGLSIAIPAGHVGLIVPRSGLAADHGVTVLNAPGVVDSGYRGELQVLLVNHGPDDYPVARGDRIAQLLVVAVAQPTFELVRELPRSERGAHGLGHSGIR